MPEEDFGPIARALAALSAAPASPAILISHDFWGNSDQYRRARWRRVQAIIGQGETPDLLIQHYSDCCSGPDGDRQFRKDLAGVLAGPEPTVFGYDEGDDGAV